MKPELLPVAAFQETLNASICGPATLKMLLSYWNLPGQEKSDVELAVACGTNSLIGTSNEQLIEAAQSFGLTCESKCNAEFADIEKWLVQKIPVIVDWFTPGRTDAPLGDMPDGHYSIVVGLDSTHIRLQDPETGGLRIIPRSQFYRVWFDFREESITTWEDMIIRWMCAVYPQKI